VAGCQPQSRSSSWVDYSTKYGAPEPIKTDQRVGEGMTLGARFGVQHFFRAAHIGGFRGGRGSQTPPAEWLTFYSSLLYVAMEKSTEALQFRGNSDSAFI
jgi:hypothetical protein